MAFEVLSPLCLEGWVTMLFFENVGGGVGMRAADEGCLVSGCPLAVARDPSLLSLTLPFILLAPCCCCCLLLSRSSGSLR